LTRDKEYMKLNHRASNRQIAVKRQLQKLASSGTTTLRVLTRANSTPAELPFPNLMMTIICCLLTSRTSFQQPKMRSMLTVTKEYV
jgi:hypothetical protein